MSNEKTSSANLDQQFEEQFIGPVKKIGPLTILLAGICSLLPVTYLAVVHGAIPPIDKILGGWAAVASTYGAFYILEPISYFATLGIAGTYMSFLSGNIGNMRLPSAAIAQEVLGTDGSTKKGELIGAIAIAGSVVLNIIVLTIIGIFGTFILAALPDVIKVGLNYILPSLFGAMMIFFGIKSIRSIFIALALTFLMMGILTGVPVWLTMIVAVFGTILINFFIYKKTGTL